MFSTNYFASILSVQFHHVPLYTCQSCIINATLSAQLTTPLFKALPLEASTLASDTVIGQVTDVSRDHSAFIFGVKQSTTGIFSFLLGLLVSEDESTAILQHFGKHSPYNTVSLEP